MAISYSREIETGEMNVDGRQGNQAALCTHYVFDPVSQNLLLSWHEVEVRPFVIYILFE